MMMLVVRMRLTMTSTGMVRAGLRRRGRSVGLCVSTGKQERAERPRVQRKSKCVASVAWQRRT